MPVFERRRMNVKDLQAMRETHGLICAWRGCTEVFKGDMPQGWTNLIMYWAKRPVLDIRAIHDWCRDAVLCPQHSFELELKLKELGRAIDEA